MFIFKHEKNIFYFLGGIFHYYKEHDVQPSIKFSEVVINLKFQF
uniref:Uncharacterized protein n=1 Tax=viral metagenome TaxID=1070528 RepID=A0A6C0AFG7_9ZZZZ